MTNERPGSEGLMCEVESLRRRVSELESECLAARQASVEAEARRRRSEDDHRMMIESIPDMVSRHHPDSTYVCVSPVCASLFGYAPDELIGRKAFDFIHPEDLPTVRILVQRALQTGGPVIGEYRHLAKTGAYLWVETTGRVILSNDRDEPRLICTVRGIPKRKQYEEELRESEERFRAVVEDQTEVINRFQANGTLTFVNDVYCRFFGKSEAELIGTRWHPMAVSEDLPHIEGQLRTLSAIHPVVVIENRVLSGSGQVHWMQFVNRGFFDAKGRLTEIQSVGRDITERKQMEQVLTAQRDLAIALSRTMDLRETLRLCLDTAMAVSEMDCGGIYLVDASSDSLNLAFSSGLSAPFVGMSSHYGPESGSTHLVMAGAPIFGRHRDLGLNLSAVESSEGLRALAIIPVQHDGRVVGCVNVASHVLDEVSVFSRAALETIAGQVGSAIQRSQTEEALAEYQKQLQLLASDLSQTEERERRRIAVYLHDQVGQSLAAVRVKLGTWKVMRPSPKRQALLSEIEQLVDQTIEDTRLLTFDLSPPILFELGLGPALEWMGENLCGKEGIDFVFQDDGRCGQIEEDLAGALYRIVRELVINAVRHARAGRIAVSVSRKTGGLEVVVEDDGIGMDQAALALTSQGRGGTFGLFSVRERLQHLRGILDIAAARGGAESSPGQGTRATVVVPLADSASSQGGDVA